MKIGELARQTGIGIETIRFYEKQGLLDRPKRLASGYRQYEESAVRRLAFVRRSKDLGFTLSDIRDLLRLWSNPATTQAEVRRRTQSKIEAVEDKIRSLQKIRSALRKHLTKCHHTTTIDECPLLEGLGARPRTK